MRPSIAISLLLIIFSCSQRTVKRITPAESIDLSGRWNDTDSREVAQAMGNELLTSEALKAYAEKLDGKPAIIDVSVA